MRLFISVDVPPWIQRGIAAAQRELPGRGIGLVDPQNAHITLKFLGEVSPKNLQKIEQELRSVEQNKFEVVVKGAGAFPNENYVRVVWMGCRTKELAELAGRINNALTGFPKEEFAGHLTIARVKNRADLRNFFAKYRDWRFGDFEVGRFYLMSSELSPSGPKYSVVAEYELK